MADKFAHIEFSAFEWRGSRIWRPQRQI